MLTLAYMPRYPHPQVMYCAPHAIIFKLFLFNFLNAIPPLRYTQCCLHCCLATGKHDTLPDSKLPQPSQVRTEDMTCLLIPSSGNPLTNSAASAQSFVKMLPGRLKLCTIGVITHLQFQGKCLRFGIFAKTTRTFVLLVFTVRTVTVKNSHSQNSHRAHRIEGAGHSVLQASSVMLNKCNIVSIQQIPTISVND